MVLGATLFAAFLLPLAVRRPLERVLVISASEVAQSKRQFFVDISLSLFAGSVTAVYLKLFYDFSLVLSGSKLVLGSAVAGFFIALDMALSRERSIIRTALAQNKALPPPKRLYSMTRKFSLVAITTTLFVSIIIGLVISKDIAWLTMIDQNDLALSRAQRSVVYEIFFIMTVLLAMVVNLIVSYSKNLKLLFDNETHVLERVSQGDLTQLVPIATNDEFGIIAGHTNTMIHGLRHRIKLITALKLAEEVQQNLLPRETPVHPGLDISGTSIYCDETGGDYYDYFTLPDGRLGVVVADASDHGVGAALYMSTARAFLIFGIRDFTGPARLLGDVNQFLTRDSAETGRFMSAFFLEIDASAKTLRWVRAGHDPAIFFDPDQDRFVELGGEGMALGVVGEFQFMEYDHQGWRPGSIVVVGTDGIHETHNAKNEMFGHERLNDVIRVHAGDRAEIIRDAVIDALRSFRGDSPQEDDITLVVIKLL